MSHLWDASVVDLEAIHVRGSRLNMLLPSCEYEKLDDDFVMTLSSPL